MLFTANMLFTYEEIKELVSAVGEVRRILRDSVKNGSLHSQERLKIINSILNKLN